MATHETLGSNSECKVCYLYIFFFLTYYERKYFWNCCHLTYLASGSSDFPFTYVGLRRLVGISTIVHKRVVMKT